LRKYYFSCIVEKPGLCFILIFQLPSRVFIVSLFGRKEQKKDKKQQYKKQQYKKKDKKQQYKKQQYKKQQYKEPQKGFIEVKGSKRT